MPVRTGQVLGQSREDVIVRVDSHSAKDGAETPAEGGAGGKDGKRSRLALTGRERRAEDTER